MSRHGKCTNYAGCLLAYRGEEAEIEDGHPFVCAECGKALTEVKPPSVMWIRYGIAVVVLAVLGGIGLLVMSKAKSGGKKPAPTAEATPAPSARRVTIATPVPEIVVSDTTPEPAPEPTKMTAPPKIDMDLRQSENKQVKSEVLTRVDLMPIAPRNKIASTTASSAPGAWERCLRSALLPGKLLLARPRSSH